MGIVSEETLGAFLLIVGRLSGLFLVAPFLSTRTIPVRVKAACVAALTIFMMPLVEIPADYARLDWMFIVRMSYEVLIGLAIGFVFLTLFLAVSAAGEIIDFQMGFGMSQVIDPVQGVNNTVLSKFYFMLAVVVFLMANGHLVMIKTALGSFSAMPVGSLAVPAGWAPSVLRLLSDVLLLALRIGAPIIGTLFVADIVFGVVARAVPQLNIFVVGFPAKILLGLVAVAVTLPLTLKFFQSLMGNLETLLARVF